MLTPSIISLELARKHLRVYDSSDNDIIMAKLEASLSICGDYTNRHILPRQMTVICDFGRRISLPVPTQNIIEVVNIETGDVIPSISYQHYSTDFDEWIEPLNFTAKRLKITIDVGYSAETLPPTIRTAALLILGTLYDKESDNIIGRSVSQLNITAEKLLNNLRVSPYV